MPDPLPIPVPEDWRQIAVMWDEAVKKFLRDVKRDVDPKLDALPSKDPNEEPADVGRTKGKVIRVGDLMAMMHMMTATVAFRTMPSVWKAKLKQLVISPSVRWLSGKAVALGVERIPLAGTVVRLLKELAGQEAEAKIEQQIEAAIRADLARLRAQLLSLALTQEYRERRVKDVLTRRYSEPLKKDYRWSSR